MNHLLKGLPKFASIAAIFVFMILALPGCFEFGVYEFPVPLSATPNIKIDPALLGQWQVLDPDDAADEQAEPKKEEMPPQYIRFLQLSAKEYILTTVDEQSCQCNLAHAYIVRVKGVPFLNIRNLEYDENNDGKRDDKRYYLCKYTFSKESNLILKFVGDTLFKDKKAPKSTGKLVKLIKKYLKNKDLYGMELMLRRD